MASSCSFSGKGVYIFDYDSRSTNNGYRHQVAANQPGLKYGAGIGNTWNSTVIVYDYEDTIQRIYIVDYRD
jgi:hypothetical protein